MLRWLLPLPVLCVMCAPLGPRVLLVSPCCVVVSHVVSSTAYPSTWGIAGSLPPPGPATPSLESPRQVQLPGPVPRQPARPLQRSAPTPDGNGWGVMGISGYGGLCVDRYTGGLCLGGLRLLINTSPVSCTQQWADRGSSLHTADVLLHDRVSGPSVGGWGM